ncbi:hypothetical protein [Schlesneria paludicola]|uniref:hypothetical protein n=1 Tax=Schlesneria paludicola TaxID=360056 RepID=UPI00029A218A|nr:hypothetical protein [Schlesneria paludicola]
MADLMRGSRRKAGIVILIIACLALSGWIRSRNIDEYVRFRGLGKTIHEIHSNFHGLAWITIYEGETGLTPIEDGEPEALVLKEGYWQRSSAASQKSVPPRSSPIPYGRYSHWRWNWGGVYSGANAPGKIVAGEFSMLLVPYFLLVIPLTLAAAWLLLGEKSPMTVQAKA